MRIIVKIFLVLLLCMSTVSYAGQSDINTLDKLLDDVRQSRTLETQSNKKREARFLSERNIRRQLLKEAQARLRVEELREARLKSRFNSNEKILAQEEEKLHLRLGSLGELFGVVRQIAGDTQAILENSLVTAQIPGRDKALKALAVQKSTPDIAQLENLWIALQDEMTRSGKVVKYSDDVVLADGSESRQTVIRVGVFNAVSNGKYLRYIPETGQLVELARQPASHYLDMISSLESSQEQMTSLAIDPSRGVILSLLVQTPDIAERITQGKLIGYIILTIAGIGFLVALERMISLHRIGGRINKQIKTSSPSAANPLGIIMAVYQQNKSLDTDSLSRKLDEVILKSIPPLQRGLSTIKILSMIAPLLGLLGTVTGMIETFQAITLFGTGDPKLMAGGISQALVTTALGLIAAIPLILLYTILSTKSKRIIGILDEQSAGLLAMQTESNKQ